MPLVTVISGKKAISGDKKAVYVGQKLKIEDFRELCGILKVEPEVGGSATFAAMTTYILANEGLIKKDANGNWIAA
jgi:hypothetical protein